ncbi:hypothetical protein DFH11DRAFT_873107 [Phellopilus nigrolimitatus]|nr:hypothetical protein DFH11DRAFT_873107 [Phellopilus nigrolimitatus]
MAEMDFPSELLDIIFELSEDDTRPDDHASKATLVPFLLVCRKWYPAAERRLYRSIKLNSNIDEGARISREWATQRIIKTLKNARIAALVTELRVVTYDLQHTDTQSRNELISMCPNLLHIEITGYESSEPKLTKLKEVLVKKDLVSLKVHCNNGHAFCKMSELFRMMEHWPKLEKVVFERLALDSEYDASLCTLPASVLCPRLREFDFCDSVPLNEHELRGLLAISGTTLETFRAQIENDENAHAAFRDCLAVWAPRLSILDLSWNRAPHGPIDAACGAMHSLKSLCVSAELMRPEAVSSLPALEVLYYFVSSTDEVEELTSFLKKSERNRQAVIRLPLLRNITLWPQNYHQFGNAAMSRLRVMCAARSIRLEDSKIMLGV